ncbi:hypothetical protein VPHF86_0208 [Vibrio phage F86]
MLLKQQNTVSERHVAVVHSGDKVRMFSSGECYEGKIYNLDELDGNLDDVFVIATEKGPITLVVNDNDSIAVHSPLIGENWTMTVEHSPTVWYTCTVKNGVICYSYVKDTSGFEYVEIQTDQTFDMASVGTQAKFDAAVRLVSSNQLVLEHGLTKLVMFTLVGKGAFNAITSDCGKYRIRGDYKVS